MFELLPVGYFHLVFTLPHQMNNICLQNRKEMYNILFMAASQTIFQLAADPKHLGAETGVLAVLHTWGQNMIEHPHLHCIVPAGGLTSYHEHWVHSREYFFVHVKVVSRLFRGKFLPLMKTAYEHGLLRFARKISGKRLNGRDISYGIIFHDAFNKNKGLIALNEGWNPAKKH